MDRLAAHAPAPVFGISPPKLALLIAFFDGGDCLMAQQARQIAWAEVVASVRAYACLW